MPVLTPSEALKANRKLFKQGPAKAAKRWKVTEEAYLQMESGTRKPTAAMIESLGLTLEKAAPRPASGLIKVPKTAFRKLSFQREKHADVPPERARAKKHTMHSLNNCALKVLTTGEALVLHRRRLDESQTEAAARLGVGRKIYALWEVEVKEFPGVAPTFETVAAHEIAFILRRRANKSRADMVAAVGLNRTWITAMERGDMDCSPLLNYWKA